MKVSFNPNGRGARLQPGHYPSLTFALADNSAMSSQSRTVGGTTVRGDQRHGHAVNRNLGWVRVVTVSSSSGVGLYHRDRLTRAIQVKRLEA